MKAVSALLGRLFRMNQEAVVELLTEPTGIHHSDPEMMLAAIPHDLAPNWINKDADWYSLTLIGIHF